MTRKSQSNPPNRVREHRERLRMTLDDLAEKSGLSPQFISHIERGERGLNDRSLTCLAQALGVRKALLLREVDVPGRPELSADIVEDDLERMILRFWRSLSPEGKDASLIMMTRWANSSEPKAASN
jgi:transcriptional regulator with XRE-family HTH domain